MSTPKKGVDICATEDCDDAVGIKYSGLCFSCHRWLLVWGQRTASEVKKRCYQINRLARRAATMPLPGLGQGTMTLKAMRHRRKAS